MFDTAKDVTPHHVVILGSALACRLGDIIDVRAERTANLPLHHMAALSDLDLPRRLKREISICISKSQTMEQQFSDRGERTKGRDEQVLLEIPAPAPIVIILARGTSAECDHSLRRRIHVIGEL